MIHIIQSFKLQLMQYPLVRKALHTFGVQVALLLGSTLVSIFMTRALGAADRGAVSWVMQYAALGISVALLGVPLAAKKYTAQQPANAPSILMLSSLMLLGCSVLVALAFYASARNMPVAVAHPTLFALALVLVPLGCFAALHNNVFLGLNQERYFHRTLLLEKGGFIGFSALLLLLSHVTALWAVTVSVLASVLRTLLALWWLPSVRGGHVTRAVCVQMLRSMWRMMVSGYVSNLALLFSQSALLLALGTVASMREVGYFAVAKLLVDMVQLVPLTVGTYATQYLMSQPDEVRYSKARAHALLLGVGCTALAVMVLVALPQTIIMLLFGDDFAPAAILLPYLALGMVGYACMLVMQTIIVAHGREHLQIAAPVAMAVLMMAYILWAGGDLSALSAAQAYSVLMLLGGLGALFSLVQLGFSDLTRAGE